MSVIRARCPSIFILIATELPFIHMTTLVRSRLNYLLSPWDTVLKKPVQSSLIFVRLGQGLFKSD